MRSHWWRASFQGFEKRRWFFFGCPQRCLVTWLCSGSSGGSLEEQMQSSARICSLALHPSGSYNLRPSCWTRWGGTAVTSVTLPNSTEPGGFGPSHHLELHSTIACRSCGCGKPQQEQLSPKGCRPGKRWDREMGEEQSGGPGRAWLWQNFLLLMSLSSLFLCFYIPPK